MNLPSPTLQSKQTRASHDGLIDATERNIPHFRIDLNQPASRRWISAGEEYRSSIQEIVDESWAMIAGLTDHLIPPSWKRRRELAAILRGVTPGMGRMSSHAARMLGGTYAAEIKGLAKGCNRSVGQLFLLNLSYDIVQAAGLLGKACASASFLDSSGSPVLARNLDWNLPECLGNYSCVTEFHNEKGSYQSIGVLGFVGVLSAMRPKQWAVTLNQAPCSPAMISPLSMPACMLLRWACDNSQSYTTLGNNIRSYKSMSPFLTHMVGTHASQQQLIQHDGNHCYQIKAKDGTLAQTNYFLDDTYGHQLNKQCEWGSSDYCDRQNLLKSRLRNMPPKPPSHGFKLLEGYTLTYEATQQQMVYCPAHGRSELRVRAA